MRIRVSRRILRVGIALALLCALPAVSPSSSVAKPYSWIYDPLDPNSPDPPKGDGDGTIVKARYIGGTTYDSASKTTVSATGQRTWSILRTYLSLVRRGIGIRWTGF